jgi:hypothetical protein
MDRLRGERFRATMRTAARPSRAGAGTGGSPRQEGTKPMGYVLEGDLLEVCNCNVLCPCWIGEDPDNGTCQSALAYRIGRGEVEGVDVSGVVVATVVDIPGNILRGNIRRQVFFDPSVRDEQIDVLMRVFTGRLGGPLADLAQLIGEEMPPRRAPITFTLFEGKGTLTIEDVCEAVMEPYRGPTGQVTTLSESIFTTIPGTPAYVSKAERFRLKEEALGIDLALERHNAIQGVFRFEHLAAAAA